MKDYVVFYQGGAGGFIVSWLLQCAIDPNQLQSALNCFPKSLKDDPLSWRKYEVIPPNIGMVCNGFFPADCMVPIKAFQYTRDTIVELLMGSDSVYNALHCRAKLYEGKGDFKAETDVLFDSNKRVFVTAPENYVKASLIHKTNISHTICVNRVINEFDVKQFPIESLWQKTYFNHLETILGRKLTNDQKIACQKLVERYMIVTPLPVQEIMNDFRV